MPTISVNGIRTAYNAFGSGEPLILLHGGHSDRHQFDVFLPLLGEGIRAIAYDQRDAPENPYEGGDYTIRDHAADCAAFIRAIGLQRAHIMGTSYGGTVAMMTAIDFPSHVASVVLAATTPSHAMLEPAVADATADLDPVAVERFMLEQVISPEAIDTDTSLVAETKAALRPRSSQAIARRMGAVQRHECRSELGMISAPTLVLHGEDDPLISAKTAVWMAGQIAGAELKLLPGSRHGVTLQHRQRTADIVREFVLRNRMGGAGPYVLEKA